MAGFGGAERRLVPAVYCGRLAPSPTGLLHLGHVRTFLVAQQRARSQGGVLRLRIDDLDPGRSRAAFAAAAEEDLRWLGLEWAGAVWFQSRRGEAYREAWVRLVEAGWVYPCRCSRRDLRAAVAAPHEGAARMPEDEPAYPGTCRPAWLPGERCGAQERAGWLADGPAGAELALPRAGRAAARLGGWGSGGRRVLCPGGISATLRCGGGTGVPAYQLAAVVDDAAMGITEVVRGADLLLSTARQLLIYDALGLPAPGWYHCPLVLDGAGERLAKRADALSVRALRAQGLEPGEVVARARAAPV